MALELCYNGMEHAQVSITIIPSELRKVAAPWKQLSRAGNGLEIALHIPPSGELCRKVKYFWVPTKVDRGLPLVWREGQ
jgi:hypothetical protein